MAKNEKTARPAVKKLKLIFTVVDRPKGDFYMDVLSGFEVNYQMFLNGQGTASSELVDLLGLNPEKAVIVSVGAASLWGARTKAVSAGRMDASVAAW